MHNDLLYLAESREWAGLWWLPDNPDERVPGVLSYDPYGGISLSLIGAFEDRVVLSSAPGVIADGEGTRTWTVVHGAAEQREITLLDAVPGSSERTFGARVISPDKQRVSATAAIIGAHISNDEEPAFSSAEVSVEDLGLWAESSAYAEFVGVTDGSIDGTGRISAKPVASQLVVVDDTEYRLDHNYTLPRLERRKGATIGRLRDAVSLKVRPRKPLSLRDALGEVRLVQDLISLATHRAAGVLWLCLELGHSEPQPPSRQVTPRRCANVLYSPTAVGKHDAKAVEHRRVFFTCASLPFEEVLPRWCEAHGTLRAAINMVLGLRYAPAEFVENNLLTAVGAAPQPPHRCQAVLAGRVQSNAGGHAGSGPR